MSREQDILETYISTGAERAEVQESQPTAVDYMAGMLAAETEIGDDGAELTPKDLEQPIAYSQQLGQHIRALRQQTVEQGGQN